MVFQHGLRSVNCFLFFLSLHSAFCDPRVMTTNGFRSKFRSHKQSVGNFVLKFRSHLRNFRTNFATFSEFDKVKFRTSARNFVNGEIIEASEISPKIRSP